jgi:hypothetical protein
MGQHLFHRSDLHAGCIQRLLPSSLSRFRTGQRVPPLGGKSSGENLRQDQSGSSLFIRPYGGGKNSG